MLMRAAEELAAVCSSKHVGLVSYTVEEAEGVL